jgi:hypothetical protein
LQNARALFGQQHVEQRVCASEPDLKVEQLLRKSLLLLVPAPS